MLQRPTAKPWLRSLHSILVQSSDVEIPSNWGKKPPFRVMKRQQKNKRSGKYCEKCRIPPLLEMLYLDSLGMWRVTSGNPRRTPKTTWKKHASKQGTWSKWPVTTMAVPYWRGACLMVRRAECIESKCFWQCIFLYNWNTPPVHFRNTSSTSCSLVDLLKMVSIHRGRRRSKRSL